MKYVIYATFLLLIISNGYAQTYGPRNPTVQTVVAGGNTWSGATGTFASDNTYASVSTTGLTETLVAKNYGFTLVGTDVITGIQLDIERKAELGNNVSLLNGWRDGENSTITNFPLSAGNSRMMFCFIANENGSDEPIINQVTYGGLPMTKVVGFSFTTGFWARLECWSLPESALATLSPGNYNINVTYAAFAQSEFFDVLSAATFANVDQNNPFFSFQTKQINGSTPNPCTFDAPITADIGGMYLTGIFCGQNTSPGSANGATNTFSIGNSFIEGTDVYRSNPSFSTSGGCMQTAHKFAPAGGSENPPITFVGTPNRRLLIGIGLRKYTSVDVNVRLLKAGTITGNNYAQTTLQWPLTDTYATYGGPGDLWGTAWLFSDINNVNFGGSLKTNIYNGNALVDHMRMTVYVTSTLPVQLIDFFASVEKEGTVTTRWLTASEHNSKHFEVERSNDGVNFETIGIVQAAGNSSQLTDYVFEDERPLAGISYYRLKQVDFNGDTEYSKIVAITSKGTNDLTIAPNPISEWAKVTSNSSNESEIFIVNSAGQVIDFARHDINDNSFMINIKHAPDGEYFLVKIENGEKSIQKLSKISRD